MTHTAKHTPGPWTARKAPERNAYAWDVEGAQGTVPTIARMALVDRVSEVEANAHLIAAAPAMYEALKAMLEHEGERVYSGIGTEHDSEVLEAAKQAARTALAQAEGVDHA